MGATGQFMALLGRNLMMNVRRKEYLRENIATIILAIFVVIIERTQSNNFITPFYMGLAITSYSRAVVIWWVQEKETHQKELQKIMGCSHLVYVVAWLTYFLLNGLLVGCVFMLSLYFGVFTTNQVNFIEGYSSANVAVLFFLYLIATIGYVMTLSTVFKTAKTAAQAITFVQILMCALYFLRFSEDFTNSPLLVHLIALLPPMAFNMGVTNIAFINSTFSTTFHFSYESSCAYLLVTGILYILSAIYLDLVWPNEMGTNKPPLFFLDYFRQTARDEVPLLEQLDAESSARYQQNITHQNPLAIRVSDVSKAFGDTKAVDNLSISFYESEIFCLLGHNGAGKSTLINLLTGMLTPTAGRLQLLGMNYGRDVDRIRQNVGLCLQYNVLYQDLTVEEHLQFYFQLKDNGTMAMRNAVESTIQKCALSSERGKLSKNLSGGNKRKLCLANAIIGGSKILFLDEPSSGLDPNSRQSIWGIIKALREEQRVVILTTHHLEEAQELSQRIGIMSHGQLVIVGGCDFIKSKFNVGSHLVVTLDPNQPDAEDKVKGLVESFFPQAVEDKQTAAGTVKFILRSEDIDGYAQLFKSLQESTWGKITVNESNLEDAFLKLGAKEQNEGDEITVVPDQQIPQITVRESFWSQFWAVFNKKRITVLRSFSSVVSVFLPTVFICLGITIACLTIKQNRPQDQFIRRFLLSYFMVWAFVFTTSSFCGYLVAERQTKFKYLSNVLGLSKAAYWSAQYAFDLLLFFIPLIGFYVLAFAFGQQGAFIVDVIGYITLSLLLFGLSFISYSYACSFVFQNSNTAYRLFPFINLIFFYVLPQIPQYSSPNSFVAQNLMPLLSPFIAFESCFFTKQIVGDITAQGFFKSDSITYNYIVMIIQTVFFLCLTMFLENIRFSLKQDGRTLDNAEEDRDQILDDYVRQDEQRGLSVLETGANESVTVKKLSKKFPNGFTAIRENSFSVKEGEIFGLLGPNGAGKSTTFNIVTAALPKTSGSVQLLGEQVNRGIMDIFRNVGVCPQYDPIVQNLTIEEHIRYVGGIKGITSQETEITLQFFSEVLSLKEYMNVKAGQLSGGNKRKLCVCMAMLANSKVMFYDEPSAGVDPVSRRYLWKSLSLAVKQMRTAMVLTTHSMNEAESLCSKIGILIKGKFACLDTVQKLKETYGKGFRIMLTVAPENQEVVRNELCTVFNVSGDGVKRKVQQNEVSLVLTVDKQHFSYSRAFELMHNKLFKERKIRKYSIK